MGASMRLVNRKVLAFAVITLLIVSGLWLGFSHKKNGSQSGQSSTYTDPFSHETVSNPSGKAPDRYGTPANQPLFLGFDKLLTYGITFDQLNETKQAFYRYSTKQTPPIKQISIDVDHITTQHDQNVHNSPFVILFNVQFNRKTVNQAKLSYQGLSDIQLTLSKDGKPVYDSGVITLD
jgi:hypothetical protein